MSEHLIRDARPEDYSAYLRLYRELGVEDPVPTPEQWVRETMPSTLVCVRAGDVVGYTAYRMLVVEAHLFHLAVAPDERRTGVGRSLMQAAAARMRAAGARAWFLNVKAGNTAAITLYESLGFALAYASTVLRIAWADVARLPAEVPSVVVALADGTHDVELERVLGLVAGRVAAQRARAGRVVLEVVEHGAAVGVACFAVEVPGAYPFRMTRPELAGPLLAAMQPHARPQDTWVQIVAEGDEALAEALVAAGARVHMQLLHYRGAL